MKNSLVGIKLSERTLKSEIVYRGKFFKVREHEVLLSNGKKTVRQIVEHPGACACVVLTENYNVLLVKQYRKAAESVLIELPAGKIDAKESPEACIKREVEEETGIVIGPPTKLAEFYPSPGFTDEKMYVFLACLSGQHETNQMDDENISSFFIPFEQALAYVRDGQINDAKSIIGLLLAKEYLADGSN